MLRHGGHQPDASCSGAEVVDGYGSSRSYFSRKPAMMCSRVMADEDRLPVRC
jgi:hypothetical protein